MLTIVNLDKYFDDFHVLKDICINAEDSQIYGLVGSNGCGKTTLFKHIMSIYTQDKGKIIYNETAIDEYSESMKDFYYISDDIYFPLGSRLRSLFEYEKLFYEKASEEMFTKLTEYFNIDTKRKLSSFSKGQKRQAAFILGLSASPKVLLLDEIVDGLDAVVRRKFWSVLLKEVADKNITVIISSHDLKEIENICDKVAIMHEGQIIREEKMDNLKENIKRVQFALEGEISLAESKDYEVLKNSKIGKVYFAVIKGNAEEFRMALEENNKVLLFDELPVNFEEIFVTELGGIGYGTEELGL